MITQDLARAGLSGAVAYGALTLLSPESGANVNLPYIGAFPLNMGMGVLVAGSTLFSETVSPYLMAHVPKGISKYVDPATTVGTVAVVGGLPALALWQGGSVDMWNAAKLGAIGVGADYAAQYIYDKGINPIVGKYL